MPTKMNFIMPDSDDEVVVSGNQVTINGVEYTMGDNDILLAPDEDNFVKFTTTNGPAAVDWNDLLGVDLSGKTLYFDTTKTYDDFMIDTIYLAVSSGGYKIKVGGPPDVILVYPSGEETMLWSYENNEWYYSTITLPDDFGIISSFNEVIEGSSWLPDEDCINALNIIIPTIDFEINKIVVNELNYDLPNKEGKLLIEDDLAGYANTKESNTFTASQKVSVTEDGITKTCDIKGSSIELKTSYPNLYGWGIELNSAGRITFNDYTDGGDVTAKTYSLRSDGRTSEYEPYLVSNEDCLLTGITDEQQLLSDLTITDEGPNWTIISKGSAQLRTSSGTMNIGSNGSFYLRQNTGEGGAEQTQEYILPAAEGDNNEAQTLATREWVENYACIDDGEIF